MESVKLLVVGDKSVGKTSIIRRFVENRFSHQVHSSVCMNYFYRRLHIGGSEIMVNIYDAPGAEEYRYFTSFYFRSVQGIMVVYDVNDSLSSAGVLKWLEDIKRDIQPDTVIMLIGNKGDLTDDRDDIANVSPIASRYELSMVKLHCQDEVNVEESFRKLISDIAERRMKLKENIIQLKDNTESTPRQQFKDRRQCVKNLFRKIFKRIP